LSLRSAAIAYAVIWLCLYFLDPASMKALSQFVEEHVLLHSARVSDAWYGSGLLSALVAALFVPIGYSVRHRRLQSSADAIMNAAQQSPAACR
jgi:hypothetical protein